MEEYFEGLHLIDFEQLKIENNVILYINLFFLLYLLIIEFEDYIF